MITRLSPLQTLDDFDAITWNLLENTSTRRHKACTSGLGWSEDFESTFTHIHNNTKIACNKGRALDILGGSGIMSHSCAL